MSKVLNNLTYELVLAPWHKNSFKYTRTALMLVAVDNLVRISDLLDVCTTFIAR